jgi:hypothetical protein
MEQPKARSRTLKAIPPVRLGSEFDLSFDMAADIPAPAKPSRPLGTSAFSSTQPVSRPQRVPVNDEVHQVGIANPRQNQPPIAMAKFTSENLSPRSNTAKSSVREPQPHVKAKMYVFGYRDEAEYIPKPFISSHRPKVPRERAASARVKEKGRIGIRFEKPAKLSKRREVVDSNFQHSIVIGSFQQLEKHYRGP